VSASITTLEHPMPSTPKDHTPKDAGNEEPQIQQEESVPSDGTDHEGEAMMEQLGEKKPGAPLSPDRKG
jgi:hypothetical protein